MYERNIKLLYLYSILVKRVSQPIAILYYLFFNLNFTQIGILLAIQAIVSLVTEIPGGLFADTYGKKWSLFICGLFSFLTMLFLLGNSFTMFIIAAILYGLSGTFLTGTRNALLYDTLVQLKKTDEFKKYNGRQVFYSHLVNAALLIPIPFLYNIHVKLPFVIGAVFFLASMVTPLFIKEPPIKKSTIRFHSRVHIAMKEILNSKKVIFAITFSVIIVGFIMSSFRYTQPLLQITGLPIIYFGFVYAALRILMGIGAEVTHRVEKVLSLPVIVLIGLVVMILGFLGFTFGSSFVIIVIAILLLQFSRGYNRIIYEDEINKNISSTNRTTILSINSFLEHIVLAVVAFAMGRMADIVGVQPMFLYTAGVFVLCIVLAYLIIRPKA